MDTNRETDPVELTARLIRCASVTPEDEGALAIVEEHLRSSGFECTRVDRNGIGNLFARWGPKGHSRTFGFNGHTDVVPPGDPNDWTVPPFAGEIRDDEIWGRGAADMKSGVAAFVAAAIDFVQNDPPDGAIILTITGDEEADAEDGTQAILDWMTEHNEQMTHCLVGEPTCPNFMGEMIKIGRRGSMTVRFRAVGIQGHAAYPDRARNPVEAIGRLVSALSSRALDEGTTHFDPSTLAVTTIDTGNPATNVIPAECRATVNVRFNDAHQASDLQNLLEGISADVAEATETRIEMTTRVSGECFLTPPGPFTDIVSKSVEAETGMKPALSTSGGTSDARFIKSHCDVVEFGLVGKTMHQVDERVKLAHIEQLKSIYGRILRDYFV